MLFKGKTSTYLCFAFAIFVLLVLPISMTICDGAPGFFKSMLLLFVSTPVWNKTIKNPPPIDVYDILKDTFHIIRTKEFLFAFITFINFFTFLKIGLQTFIKYWVILSIFCLSIAITFTIYKWKVSVRDEFRHSFFSFCLAPFVINLFLMLNFVFSHDPVTESYFFRRESQKVGQDMQESALIILEEYKYSEYPGIRIFFDDQSIDRKHHISYRFKSGLFGFRVMENFKFSE